MLTFEYVKKLILAERDVPWRTCAICNTPMSITQRQYYPHLIACKCRKSGEQVLVRWTWDDLKAILEGKPI